ncbi:MAG: glutathione S-transferase family protein [Holophagales bacterium]|nr:glutathione S-transferase family protein [Holophagales bacterium]MYD22723.1 glutathione S-transferase family protein [Holophagales bacterium]MYI31555.1 glutathione S-transferase family protein [Holophagales bacterium]
MKLYWCPQTRSSRAVWMLEEAGVDYELVHVDVTKPERTPEHLAASPMGKVPALQDGEVKMWDSAAICLYVADRYAPGRLAPALDDPLRARFVHWLIYSPAMIEPAMFESGLRTVVPEEHQAEAFNAGRLGWGSFAKTIEVWEDGLGDGPWILGDEFSAADVMLGSSAVFLRMFGMLPESPVLEAYGDRCLARPAFQKAQAAEVPA